MKIVLGFGANLGEREASIDEAKNLLVHRLGPVLAFSSIIETPALVPQGKNPREYPKYLNAAGLFETSLNIWEIFECVRGVEKTLGRLRENERERWESRVLDIDILAAEEIVFSHPTLQIPHPEMHARHFVLVPFKEVWPNWKHPILNKTLDELLVLLKEKKDPM